MNKEAYDENDIVHSGDIGIMDDKGNIRIVGRTKDMILRGGQNIFPKEIEDLLMKHPKVKDVAIVGMPDKDLGEKACAYIVPVPGEKVALEEITAFLDEHKITKYKWPERIELIDQLPTSTGGKVHKTALKEDITEKLKKEGKI
jgi:non-ribosomal peptide synthetase component E (peptide arylation enzyme)